MNKLIIRKTISIVLCAVMMLGFLVNDYNLAQVKADGMTYVLKIMFITDTDDEFDTIVRELPSKDAPFGGLTAQIPVKEGYQFLGWTSEECNGADRISYEPIEAPDGTVSRQIDENWSFKDYLHYSGLWSAPNEVTDILRLKPVWVKDHAKKYTVTFDGNGGTGVQEPITKVEGLWRLVPDNVPVRDGYAFIGWGLTRDARVSRYNPGAEIEVEEDTTVYALWKKTVTLTYDANGGINAPAKESVSIYNAESSPCFSLNKGAILREGYEFMGWAEDSNAKDASYKAGYSYKFANDITLYAVWKEVASTFTITYDVKGGSVKIDPQTKKRGEDIRLSSVVPEKSKYTFMGWATTSYSIYPKYQPGDLYTKDEDVTLYAVWELQEEPPVNPPVDPSEPETPVDPPQKLPCSIHAPSSVIIPIDAKSAYIDFETNSDGKRTFKSSATSVATIDANGKITPKKIGAAKITIKIAATDDFESKEVTVSVTVGPKKVTISKVSSPKKKYMKVTWKKNTTVTGYQIAYSTDKTFAKGTKTVAVTKQKTVSKTIKATSKKTYYVRIRGYKTVSGKKYYGPWSSVKSVKIK